MLISFKTKSFFYLTFYLLFVGAYSLDWDNQTAYIESHQPEMPAFEYYLQLLDRSDSKTSNQALKYVAENWNEAHEILLLETAYFSQGLGNSKRLITLLEEKTGKRFGFDFDKWFQWLWNKEPTYAAEYFQFKAELHKRIDQRFATYFQGRDQQAQIRLDEVRWGGVLQDGIPPLRGPKMISAGEATYLRDGATVFGIEVNGDARAYPKQILAWHEMLTDVVGGVEVAGVYCTLCGTVILYETRVDDITYQLGTSGFLYRSNKLMYDRKTQSLWSTLEGQPVIGPLVGQDIQLPYRSVVTTTWGEWKKRHPETKVLSLDTGHRRDYREGKAYEEYFATDKLMFTVPKVDGALKNKDEILAIRINEFPDENLAISSNFLKKHAVYQNAIGEIQFTVFTDRSGAHRVFKSSTYKFEDFDGNRVALDQYGTSWTIHEDQLISENGKVLERLESHNAFWFGYKAAFPNVTLIK